MRFIAAIAEEPGLNQRPLMGEPHPGPKGPDLSARRGIIKSKKSKPFRKRSPTPATLTLGRKHKGKKIIPASMLLRINASIFLSIFSRFYASTIFMFFSQRPRGSPPQGAYYEALPHRAGDPAQPSKRI